MTVIVINPNSTQAMTRSALAAAQQVAPDICFEAWTSHAGPPAIEGLEDGLAAVPPLLALVRKASDQGAAVIIIACFDDTGLVQAQTVASCPVIGIGQASYVMAGLISGPTAVITTVDAAVPVIKSNIEMHGIAASIPHVLAARVPVLMLEQDPQTAANAFEAAALKLPEDTANLILGCSGAVTIRQEIQNRVPMNVIDGVTAAARLSKALVD